MKFLIPCLLAVFAFSGCKESSEKPMADEVEPVHETDGTDFDFEGLSEKEAGSLAEKRDLKHRVVERDGQPLPATRDFRPDRVNFTVKAGKVISVSRG
ncbi:MAG: hypothetical protein P1U86_01595 [Verrucomicrobiales bacterium]|nr:hypothetical protein [Verrucomicrobiales bacterium]